MKKILVLMCIVASIFSVIACSKQKNIYTYSIDNNEVTITGLTEYGKTMNQLVIPDKIKGNKVTNIGVSAFEKCNNIQNVEVSSSIQLIDTGAFYSCENLEYVLICGSVDIGNMAFSNCESLIEFKTEEKVKSIGFQCFSSTGLSNIDDILKSVDTVREASFLKSNKIEKMMIPDNVEVIQKKAFAFCDALREVWIPQSVKDIGEDAFNGDDLTIITSSGSVAEQYAIDNQIPYEIRDDL